MPPARRLPRLAAAALAGAALVAAAPAAALLVTNQATIVYAGDGPPHTLTSNLVQTRVATPPSLRYFQTADHDQAATVTSVGSMLHLGARADGCNQDPAAAESVQVRVRSKRIDAPVVLTARETGPDTGEFRAVAYAAGPGLQPSIARSAPGDAAMAAIPALHNDVVEATLAGCGAGDTTAHIAVDPGGTVFDGETGAPLAGVRVSLIDAASGAPARVFGADGVTSLPASVVTGPDGRYRFPVIAAGNYRYEVVAPAGMRFPSRATADKLAGAWHLRAGASWGAAFTVGAPESAADLPLDPLPRALSVRKTASRARAEVAESLEYTVAVRNSGETDLSGVSIEDTLPAGFAYVPGSARLDQERLADPAGGRGPRLVFAVPPLAVGAERSLRYRVMVGALALHGDGVNRAQAYATAPRAVASLVASAAVKIDAGVFSAQAQLLGKVYADCNANGEQDAGEAGVPGVRLLMEDGTYAITDGRGQYSLPGISARTHVLKIDPLALPPGLAPRAASSRHAGDGASRFVDARRGELHRADFALAGCIDAAAASVATELAQALRPGFQPTAEAPAAGDTKALPARGVVGEPADIAAVATRAAATRAAATPAPPEPALAQRVAQADPALAFIDLADGAVLARSPATVRVKGPLGARLELQVDGRAAGVERVGATLSDAQRGLQAQEHVGLLLAPGTHRLVLRALAGGDAVLAETAVTVRVPGTLARIELQLPPAGAPADGSTAAAVRVRLLDAHGLPVAARTALTIDSTLGSWDVTDLDPAEPGLQTFVEGGSAVLPLRAPRDAGRAGLRAQAQGVRGEAELEFVPPLRPLVAAGIVEGTIDLRRLDARALVPARRDDGFETELRSFASTGNADLRGRAAMILQGKVRGDAVLTLAYDSDKDTRERLFRDIQPDRYYAVYGDASVRGYDAQSTSRLYVRVERERSFVLYGDHVTPSAPGRQLGAFRRSLTGALAHHDDGRVTANVHAARTSSRQVVDEFAANGTSGPYTLSAAEPVENSEKIEVLVRDRAQPARVLRSTPQQRFLDYELEPLTGRLLLRAPLPSLDADFNPVSIRVTYEAEQGGERYWVAGADAQVRLTATIEVGAAYAEDDHPIDGMRIGSANAAWQAGAQTRVSAELAHAGREAAGSGSAARIEVQHEGDKLKLRAAAARAEAGFDNPSSSLGRSREEATAQASYAVDERLRWIGEALHSADTLGGTRRDGAKVGLERSFDGGVKLEAGLRRVRDQGTTGAFDTTSVRTRLGAPLPGVPAATVFGEAEQDVHDAGKRLLAVGGDVRLGGTRARVYARHEFLSSLPGVTALDATATRRNTTLVGVDAAAPWDGRAFSEYRLRDALDGRAAEAAMGLRNEFTVAEGVRLSTRFERVQALQGAGTQESLAVSVGVEITRDPAWKATGRLELRDSTTTRSVLSTVGFARKLDDDWTFLGRNAYALQRDRAGAPDRLQERAQLGVAYRDGTRNRRNGLARYEFRREDGGSGAERRDVHIVSAHGDWQPERRTTLSAAYAAKHAAERLGGGLRLDESAQLASLRITRELGARWDAGVVLRLLASGDLRSRAGGVGIEAGYRVMDNLWVSLGVNATGFKERDLGADERTQQGAYLRLRFKFDESLLGRRGGPGAAV